MSKTNFFRKIKKVFQCSYYLVSNLLLILFIGLLFIKCNYFNRIKKMPIYKLAMRHIATRRVLVDRPAMSLLTAHLYDEAERYFIFVFM